MTEELFIPSSSQILYSCDVCDISGQLTIDAHARSIEYKITAGGKSECIKREFNSSICTDRMTKSYLCDPTNIVLLDISAPLSGAAISRGESAVDHRVQVIQLPNGKFEFAVCCPCGRVDKKVVSCQHYNAEMTTHIITFKEFDEEITDLMDFMTLTGDTISINSLHKIYYRTGFLAKFWNRVIAIYPYDRYTNDIIEHIQLMVANKLGGISNALARFHRVYQNDNFPNGRKIKMSVYFAMNILSDIKSVHDACKCRDRIPAELMVESDFCEGLSVRRTTYRLGRLREVRNYDSSRIAALEAKLTEAESQIANLRTTVDVLTKENQQIKGFIFAVLIKEKIDQPSSSETTQVTP